MERNLARESADELVAAIESGKRSRAMLPWVPLMSGGDAPALAERWKRLAEGEPDHRQRSEYASLAKFFADAAGCKPFWEEQLKGWNVRESTIVKEWIAEDRMEVLLVLLADKFGPVPPDLETAIRGVTAGDRLQNWMSITAKVATLDEFRKQAGV